MAAQAPMIDLPADLEAARRVIAEADLDVLHYPEIGLDPFTYFLAFARLAPLQTTTWGHPVTTGIPNVDIFMSPDAMEPADGTAHYTEQLVRLRELSINAAPPDKPAPAADNDLGLVAGRPAYVCAQSLHKLHCDFDGTIALLLRQDRAGMIYFVSHGTVADTMLTHRLARIVGADMARVRLLPRFTPRNFLRLLGAADVLLDVPQWAGGKTSLESLAMGTPIVHWPGAFMRGRHTLAFLRKMTVTATVVDSAQAYVDTAVRLAHDAAFRRDVRGNIAARSNRLFGDVAAVREIEDVWIRELAART
jgi:predicted O-linked N-acetylglucosamine transferase (SPINDLY family)